MFHGIEIKGSCRKGSTWSTFTFKDIRIQNTHWKHLFLLGRVREPASWLSVSDVESCVWLGYVSLSLSPSLSIARSPSLSYAHTHTKRRNNTNRHIYPTRHVNRADYIRALDADGRSHLEPQDATVTPRCVRGWLSTAVSWTRLQHLTLGWWHRRVLRADE